MTIPDEALVAATKAAWARYGSRPDPAYLRTILDAAAPYMLEQVERELRDAKRMVAILLLRSGGTVTVERNEVVELPDDVELQMMERPIAGDWVISAKVPTRG